MLDHEPPIKADDTQPRPPVVAPGEPTEDIEQRGGCANPLLTLFVLVSVLVLFVATVGLAGLAGYRDGVNDAATYAARTRVAAVSTQRALIVTDLQTPNWESALARCQFVGTLQPGDPAIDKCIADSQRALNATVTPTVTATSAPTNQPTLAATKPAPNSAPTQAPTQPSSVSGTDPQEWFVRAQEELRNGNYEQAKDLLEAVQGADPNFNRKDVEAALCTTYETLGTQYDAEARLSEMVVVINKAFKLSCRLRNPGWAFTVNAAQLYLDAKGYLDAGNYAKADNVFRRLISLGAGNYQDAHNLACQAFAKAGDAEASKANNCG